MVSCQKGPTRHAYAWQIGPFWQDTLDISVVCSTVYNHEHIEAWTKWTLVCEIRTFFFKLNFLYVHIFIHILMNMLKFVLRDPIDNAN